MTDDAPAARARATSRGCRTPPSAQTCAPRPDAAVAHSRTAENWGRPTPATDEAPPSPDGAGAAGRGNDVPRHDGDGRRQCPDGAQRGEHLLLVPVRGVHHEDVDLRIEKLL